MYVSNIPRFYLAIMWGDRGQQCLQMINAHVDAIKSIKYANTSVIIINKTMYKSAM